MAVKAQKKNIDLCHRTLTSCVRERLSMANDGSDCKFNEVTSLQEEHKAANRTRQVDCVWVC